MSRFAQTTFAEVKQKACKACKLEEIDVVMWDFWGDNFYGSDGPLDNFPDEKMSSGKLMENQAIMLLEKVNGHGLALLVSCLSSNQAHLIYPRAIT